MREVTVSTSLRAAPEDVYDFLVDNRNDPLWCPMASDVELVEGEPGEGALYRFQQARGPGQSALTAWMRTIVADRPHRLAWDNGGRGLEYHARIQLEQRGERTRVTHTNRVGLPDPVQQVVWWVGANVVLRRQLRNLRRQMER